MRIHNLAFVALSLTLPLLAVAAPACSATTLRGTYIWTGTGSAAPGGTWFPKAIVEQLRFDGAGNVTVLAGTIANRSGDGQVLDVPPGTAGTYTVDATCTSKVQFVPLPNFNLVIAPDGQGGTFIQTDAGNVLQGTLLRVSH